jgi:hypothetical protein
MRSINPNAHDMRRGLMRWAAALGLMLAPLLFCSHGMAQQREPNTVLADERIEQAQHLGQSFQWSTRC